MYTYTPEQVIFTEREAQDILSRIEHTGRVGRARLVCRIDGITCYTIEKTKNNEESMAQYKVSLERLRAGNFESYPYTLSYAETFTFLRAFRSIIYEYNPFENNKQPETKA